MLEAWDIGGEGVMGKYSTKKTDEDGKVTYEASDGTVFKSSGAAHKHSVKLEDEEFEAEKAAKEEEKEASIGGSEGQTGAETPIENPETDPGESKWSSFDWGEDDDDATAVVPTILKKIRPAEKQGRSRKTKKALEAERQVNLAVLTTGYKAGDIVLTKYKRVMLDDKGAEPITHSEEDYEWISDVTNAALMHNGVSIGAAIGPTQVAMVANTYWFGSEIVKVNTVAKKSPFKGRFRRILRRIPFIGKRMVRAEEPDLPKEFKDDNA
jgi:hypothetical protein